MQKIITKLSGFKLVGLSARTSNAAESEASTAKIRSTGFKYFKEKWFQKIPNRLGLCAENPEIPGVTYCVYTDYESDASGSYTYFIGEKVSSFEGLPEGLETLVIPDQTYVKFTTDSGPFPKVCIDAWQDIWKMSSSDLGGSRAFVADFEVYDERSYQDPSHMAVVLDILIGIK